LLTGLLLVGALAGCEDDKSSIGAAGGSNNYQRYDSREGPLTLTAIRPAEVPASGGAPVVAVGTGFREGIAVTVGGTTLSEVEALDEYGTTLLFVAPAGEEGAAVDVVVTNLDGTSATLPGGLAYGPPLTTELPDPGDQRLSLSELQPAEVPADGGALVVVTGTGFGGALGVSLGEQD